MAEGKSRIELVDFGARLRQIIAAEGKVESVDFGSKIKQKWLIK